MSEAAHPVGVGVETARGEQAAGHRPHRAAGDADDAVPTLAQDLEDPDVRVTAGSAATERHGDPGPDDGCPVALVHAGDLSAPQRVRRHPVGVTEASAYA